MLSLHILLYRTEVCPTNSANRHSLGPTVYTTNSANNNNYYYYYLAHQHKAAGRKTNVIIIVTVQTLVLSV